MKYGIEAAVFAITEYLIYYISDSIVVMLNQSIAVNQMKISTGFLYAFAVKCINAACGVTAIVVAVIFFGMIYIQVSVEKENTK